MAGRRRRAPSNSTVATIDEAAIQYYQEETVLKPASSRAHPDDWPCFLLVDATIYHRNGTLANLLHVDLEGPLIVRGRVEIEKDQERFLVNRHIKGDSPRIQIQNTLSFSIGLKEDGLPMPVLWASGGAGWYEIVPSEAYTNICDIMFQGISLHYAILVEYEATLQELHKKKKNSHKTLCDVKLPLDDVLFKYALTVGDGITLSEAHQRTKDQAIFLLSHFPKDTEFHNWLTHQFPTIVKRLAKKESNDSKNARKAELSSLVAVPYPPLEKSSSVEATDNKKKGRPLLRNSASRSLRHSVTTGSDVPDLSSDEQIQANLTKVKHKSPRKIRSESSRSVDMMAVDVPDDQHHSLNAADSSGKPTSREASGTHLDTSSSFKLVFEALQDIRQEMLELLDEGKQKKHPDDMSPKSWCTKLYLELSIRNPKALPEICEYFARDLVRFLAPEWHKSQFYEWVKDNIDTMPNFEFIAEEDIPKIARRKKKGKPSREETQSTPGSKELPARTAGKQPPQRGRPGGKVAGLRPSTGSKKRLRQETSFEDDEMDIDEDGVLRKTSKRSRYFDDDEQDDDVDDTSSSISDDEGVDNADSPLTRIVIRAEKLPSTTPKGPNQTWTCEEPDCSYIVRAADEEDGQALINHHYEAHEKDAQAEAEQSRASLMDLAVQESQKGHIPINHLLEKIRNMGEKAQKRGEVQLNGQVVPQPIKRGLLV
ncbi:hypothetical protein F4781DRAFT_160032 [Annulohypoxylon bovei var. microspora]|nr:hypothetical protein F4781DRAFT_160032 [Annulohypoxylon bovei var. microspora]